MKRTITIEVEYHTDGTPRWIAEATLDRFNETAVGNSERDAIEYALSMIYREYGIPYEHWIDPEFSKLSPGIVLVSGTTPTSIELIPFDGFGKREILDPANIVRSPRNKTRWVVVKDKERDAYNIYEEFSFATESRENPDGSGYTVFDLGKPRRGLIIAEGMFEQDANYIVAIHNMIMGHDE